MHRQLRVARVVLSLAGLPLLAAAPSRADVPAGYQGKPFDPAVAGGVGKIPATVKAGPYPLPGRIDFVNYDLGGSNVAYKSGDHITNNGSESIKLALGYRTDAPTATLCLSNQAEKDEWYQTSAALDGTFFPSATSADYYIGAVRPGDWFNFTVNVLTAGTYVLSSTWASGNGPPGGEGGDGAMELQVYINNQMLADWKATFPNYQTDATFHNWKGYPNLATITLSAGIQLLKLQSVDPHLNLAYVQFSRMLPDGGLDDGGGTSGSGGAGGAGAGGGGGNMAGNAGIGGASAGGGGANGNVGGGTAAGGALGISGSTSSAGSSTSNEAGSSGASSNTKNDSSCAFAAPRTSMRFGFALALVALCLAGARRRPRALRRSRQ